MSQTFFSKLDSREKLSRLGQLGNSRGIVTVWVKGKKEKIHFDVSKFDLNREEIVLDSKEDAFPHGSEILCTFELRGMVFFSQVNFLKSIADYSVLHFKNDLFKSERRSSYRLLTFPIYDVWAEFDTGEVYEGRKVVDLKSKVSQTKLFQNFLMLIDGKTSEQDLSLLKIRVQDLSATGMAIHINELESKYFNKDHSFKNVKINFSDELIMVPEVKVVYVVDYISSDKNLKKFKVGLHFPNLPIKIDDQLGKKINSLLREVDSNKDFEKFLK
jgi:hypothetical protein